MTITQSVTVKYSVKLIIGYFKKISPMVYKHSFIENIWGYNHQSDVDYGNF